VVGKLRAFVRAGRPAAPAAAALAAALVAAAPAHAQLGDRSLRFGDQGGDVRALQGYLDAMGYRTAESGRYDRFTRSIVRGFEADYGLRVDGVVSPPEAGVIKQTATASPGNGGTRYRKAPPPGPAPTGLPVVVGERARVLPNGLAAAPANAPAEVKAIIAAGNEIARLPYKWGGGHAAWRDSGYDCSGSVTYAFRTSFRRGRYPTFGYSNWGLPGPGRWVTVYASSWHVFMVVAGLRFDTSGLRIAGSRWTTQARSMGGFVSRHPPSF
jgi:cell wall-associated NlpC family hydrolase